MWSVNLEKKRSHADPGKSLAAIAKTVIFQVYKRRQAWRSRVKRGCDYVIAKALWLPSQCFFPFFDEHKEGAKGTAKETKLAEFIQGGADAASRTRLVSLQAPPLGLAPHYQIHGHTRATLQQPRKTGSEIENSCNPCDFGSAQVESG